MKNHKILTVVVSAYNMEKYIEENLESCIVDGMEKLEVLIMNDGSTDKTEEIVRKYCKQYPDVFFLFNKENGNWGSNVNLAVKLARGKYFRILDADDWFDKPSLEVMIKIMEEVDDDVIVNQYLECYPDRVKKGEQNFCQDMENQHILLSEVQSKDHLIIWTSSFKTEIVKRYHCDLPSHCFYMDSVFIYQLLKYIESVYVTNLPLYCYRLGRDGQSMSLKSYLNNYKDLLIQFELILRCSPKRMDEQNAEHRINMAVKHYYFMYKIFYVYFNKPKNIQNEIKKHFISLEMEMKQQYLELYKSTQGKAIKVLRISHYVLWFPFARYEYNRLMKFRKPQNSGD